MAERHADLKNKRRDFLHKLSNYYSREDKVGEISETAKTV